MGETTKALVVLGFGSIMLIFLIVYSIYIYKTCNEVVIGTVIAITNYGKKNSRSQFPAIGYYYNGKQYSKVTVVRSKEPLVTGQPVEIYINPKKPLSIYHKSGNIVLLRIVPILIVFIIVGAYKYFNG
jgi:hypothetical protein